MMKTKSLLFALLLSCSAFAQQLLESEKAKLPFITQMKNGGAELGTAGWTEVGGGTLSTGTSSPFEGNRYITYDASATSDEVLSEAVTVRAKSGACLAEFWYKGGGTADITFSAYDGSANVGDTYTISSAAAEWSGPVQMGFACPASGTIKLRGLAAGNAASISIDKVYIGRDHRVGVTQGSRWLGSHTWAATASCGWNTTSTSYADLTDADCDDNARTTLGELTESVATAGQALGVGFPWKGPGTYRLTVNGGFNKGNSTAEQAYWRAVDGDGTVWSGEKNCGSSGANSVQCGGPAVFEKYYSAPPTVKTVKIQAKAESASTAAQITATVIGVVLSVDYIPSTREIVLRSNDPAYGAVKYAGTSGCVWINTNSSFANFAADTDCPAATTAGAAAAPSTKVPAATFGNIPAGTYLAVASGLFRTNDSSSGSAICSWRFSDGTVTSDTAGSSIFGVSDDFYGQNVMVAVMDYTTSATSRTVHLQSALTSGNGSCDVYVNVANTDFAIRLIPMSQGMSRAFVPGSLYAGRSSVVKVCTGELNCDAASSIVKNEDSCVATIGNQSGADCAGTWTSGFWKTAPVCVAQSTTSAKLSQMQSESTTTFNFRQGDDDAGAASTGDGRFICVGE